MNKVGKKIEILIKRGVRVDEKDNSGFTALHYTSEHPYNDAIIALLKCGANVNEQNKKGLAAIHFASKMKYEGTMRVLLENGSDVDVDKRDDGGLTALHHASMYGDTEAMELLLEFQADADKKDNDGFTALHHASEDGMIIGMSLLLEVTVNVDEKDKKGFTAVEELLSQGASVNYMAEGGSTPLHAACIRGYENIVEVLESKKTEERRPMKERPRTKRPKINMLRENANVVAPLVTEKLVGLICPREGGGRSTNKSLLIMTTVRRSCRKKRQLIYTYTASHIPHTRAGNTLYDANQLLLIVYNITQPLCAVFRSQASIWKTR